MPTIKYESLTDDQKEQLINSTEGAIRIISLQKKIIKSLREDINHTINEIRDKESIAISWMNLTIVLAILQTLPALSTDLSRSFILACLPSFFIGLFSAALTLLRHPNYISPNYFETEEDNLKLLFKKNDAEIIAFTQLKQALTEVYNWKIKTSKYIGPSMISNLITTLMFIILTVFFEISIPQSLLLFILSIAIILIIPQYTSKRKTISFSFDKDSNLIKKD
jgi:hypothetical protein